MASAPASSEKRHPGRSSGLLQESAEQAGPGSVVGVSVGKPRRGVAPVALGILLVLLVLLGLGWWLARRSLPRVSGEIAVGVGNLAGAIEIVRDRHAVPHVFARTETDAVFGLGYVHAQDRLWQMELHRRLGSGTLAEIFGEDAVEDDRFFRTLGLRRVAVKNLHNLEASTRAVLEAYANGVNAFLSERRSLPPEFVALRVEPSAWTPTDSLVTLKVMAWMLSGNFRRELLRVRLLHKLAPQQVAEFLNEEALPALPFRELYGALAPAASGLMARLPGAAFAAPIGSNSWVVDGSRSQTGRPLLANDPHLDLTVPTMWYLAQLTARDLNVVGGTIPGLPTVILGRTDHVAWSFTNTESDTQDLYIEKLEAADANRYSTPQGPTPFIRVDEIIRVKGRPEERLVARSTRHGPVISDAHEGARRALPAGHVLALSWAALEADDRTLEFSVAAARARSSAELFAAARHLHSPQQNIVYADVAGAIGFLAAGRVPVRRDDTVRGRVPVPGWIGDYDWKGFVPFEELPQSSAPASGRIVTANQDIRPPEYQHWLGSEWALPYRAERIQALLDATPKHTRSSFGAMQMDVRSGTAVALLPLLLTLVMESDAERAALERLRAWNREMQPDRSEPLVFAAWIRELAREIYADELGELFDDVWSESPEFLRAVLEDRNGRARWCDNVTTAPRESCREPVTRALQRALAFLSAAYGNGSEPTVWSKAHLTRSSHVPFGGVPVIGRWFDVVVPGMGDNHTINVAGYSIDDEDEPFVSRYGAGYRAIYDLADLERSVFVVSTGQAGHFLSPHYADQSTLWSRGAYVPMTTRRELVERDAIGTLTLLPGRSKAARAPRAAHPPEG